MSIYACSDLHGHLNLLKQIQSFLKPDDKVYFLGDAGDRGPEPWKTIEEIARDSRFIYLKGNHEDLLVKAMKDYLCNENFGYNFQLLCLNGGEDTFLEWHQKPKEFQYGWYRFLNRLPLVEKYKNVYLTHAGFNVWEYEEGRLEEDALLWDRSHYFTNEKFFSNIDSIVIHGHTPIKKLTRDLQKDGQNVSLWQGGAFWYCGGKKCDIDCGTYYMHMTVLLDLDTKEEFVFKEG